jgi:ADP-ribose pyrophosphatase
MAGTGITVTLESHTVELPDGRVLRDWPWLTGSDFVNVMAMTNEGKLLCFRQTKYGIEGTSLAPVGGRMEPGEEPLETAQRELLEETGYEAEVWTDLGSYRVSAVYGMATAYFFLAEGARYVQPPCSDDLEEQQLLQLAPDKMREALAAGEIKGLSWAATVALTLLHLADC